MFIKNKQSLHNKKICKGKGNPRWCDILCIHCFVFLLSGMFYVILLNNKISLLTRLPRAVTYKNNKSSKNACLSQKYFKTEETKHFIHYGK